MAMRIVVDDLSSPKIAQFLEEHIEDMRSVSPPESKHALDLDGLRQRDVTFWSVWLNDELVGCGALKRLDETHAELKSMRTSTRHRGAGVGASLLQHILVDAREQRFSRISLETGSMDFFVPARQLYNKAGFVECLPFAGYVDDPNSVFMTYSL
jgi:putative acetyltransferase